MFDFVNRCTVIVELCICSYQFYFKEVVSNAIQRLYIMYLFECHTVLK